MRGHRLGRGDEAAEHDGREALLPAVPSPARSAGSACGPWPRSAPRRGRPGPPAVGRSSLSGPSICAPGVTSSASRSSSPGSSTTSRPRLLIRAGWLSPSLRSAPSARARRVSAAACGTAGQRAQQPQRGPPADALTAQGLAGNVHALAGVGQHVVEQGGVLGDAGCTATPRPGAAGKGVSSCRYAPMSARRRCTRWRASVSRARSFSWPGRSRRQRGEVGIQQLQQAAEGVLLAAVRRGRHQHQVALRVARPGLRAGGSAGGVCRAAWPSPSALACASSTITNSGALRQEVLPPAVTLHEIQADTTTCG